MRHDFTGWSLEHWSLAHELLELRFHRWPTIEDIGNDEDDGERKDKRYYRGKGMFSRPIAVVFHDLVPPETVAGVSIKENKDKGTICCRFALARGAFVEVEAEGYATTLW